MIPLFTRLAMRPRSWNMAPKPDADPLAWTDAAVLVVAIVCAVIAWIFA